MSEGNTKTCPAPCKRSFCFGYKMKQGKFIKPSNMSVSEWKRRSGPLHLWGTIWMFFFSLGTEKVEKCKVCVNSVLSLTWPASTQIYWNKKKRLHKKRLPQDWFGTQTWPPFHCFGTQIWPPWRHVKTHNIFTKVGAKNRLFVEPSCSTCPVASVVPPPCASLTSSAAIPSTFCSSPFVWLYSGCPPSVTVWEKSYKQSISTCINKLKLLFSNHLQLL